MGFFERLFYAIGLTLAAWHKPELFIALGLSEASREKEIDEEPKEYWEKF